jgi:hypothetical protein
MSDKLKEKDEIFSRSFNNIEKKMCGTREMAINFNYTNHLMFTRKIKEREQNDCGKEDQNEPEQLLEINWL